MKPTQIDARPIIDSLMRDMQRALQDVERERARVKLVETAAVNRLRRCCDSACTCGGRGPKDDGVCPACLVWHSFVETPVAEKQESPPT